MNNRVYAINAITGKQELNFSDFTGLNMVAGNNPQSIYNGIGASNIVINEKLGILVSGHDAEIDADNGRGFFAGWNLNTNPVTMKWITYDVPPQPGSNVRAEPQLRRAAHRQHLPERRDLLPRQERLHQRLHDSDGRSQEAS